MNKLLTILIGSLFIINSPLLHADETEKSEANILSEDELENKIGRYGEERDLLDPSEVRDSAKLVFLTDHLSNVAKPSNIYYEWETSGKEDPGFTDSVYLTVLEVNEDGTKNTDIAFFTGPRRFRNYSPDIANNVRGNPIVNIYLSGSVYNIMKLVGKGTFNYYQRQMRDSLGVDATIEPVTFTHDGKEYQGEKVVFTPFIDDKRSTEYEPYSHKVYEMTFSKDIPGQLYEIKSIVPDLTKPDSDTPYIVESLLYKSIKVKDS